MASFSRVVMGGSTNLLNVTYPYLDKSHIHVYLDGVELDDADYTWQTDSQIAISAGNPVAGTIGETRRITPEDAITTFSTGNLDVTDLNVASLQPLYLAEEARDKAGDYGTRGWVTSDLGTGGTITKGSSLNLAGFDDDGNVVPRDVPEVFDLNFFGPQSTASQTTQAKLRVDSVASQSLDALNDQGVGTDPGAANLVPYSSFGTKLYEYVRQKVSHVGAALTMRGLFLKTVGSGANGPQHADNGLAISIEKVESFTGDTPVGSYLTAMGEGELEPTRIIIRQGRKGDAAGGLADVRKVFTGTGDDTGSVLGYEYAVSSCDADGTTIRSVHVIPGFLESLGGPSSGQGYGNWIEIQKGAFFSGDHIGLTLPADGEAYQGPNSLTYWKTFATSRNVASISAALGINGELYQGLAGDRRVVKYDATTGTWSVQDETGAIMFQFTEKELTYSGTQWSTYTPTLSTSSGAITTSTRTGRFKKIGKTCHFMANAIVTDNGTGAGLLLIGLPTAAAGPSTRKYIITGQRLADNKLVMGVVYGGNTYAVVTLDGGAYPAVSGSEIVISGTYEHADA